MRIMEYSEYGSLWRRWDVHIHAPETLHNDNFKGDWEGYLSAIENAIPKVSALGITDYFTLDCYKNVLQKQKEGRLKDIWLFPNVELRLDIAGKKWINFHFIFSTEDVDHVEKIEKELRKLSFKTEDNQLYQCSNDELIQLGQHHDSSQTDLRGALKLGAMQFKAKLDDIDRILESPWIKKNAITAVSGAHGDGTSALQGASEAIRKRIESLADIIFSGNEGDRKYWLSPDDGRAPKPVIFSCDAHDLDKVLLPKDNKNLWIKGDLCFDTLRQIVIEPERRIQLGKAPELDPPPYAVITSIEARNSPWFTNQKVMLNSGLIAIIGARGSGKTALADLIAMGAGVLEDSNRDSFISRAREHLSDLSVDLKWGGGESSHALSEFYGHSPPSEEVKYLSQHFVNRLCSHENQDALNAEIERIIFNSLNPDEKQNTSSFSDLESLLLKPYQSDREQIKQQLDGTFKEIVQHTKITDSKALLEKRKIECDNSLRLKNIDLEKFLENDEDKREVKSVSDKISDINNILHDREQKKGEINRTKSRIEILKREVLNIERKANHYINKWSNEYSDIPSLIDLWGKLSFTWDPTVLDTFDNALLKLDVDFRKIDNPDNIENINVSSKNTYKDFIFMDIGALVLCATTTLQEIYKVLADYVVSDEHQKKAYLREQANLDGLRRRMSQIEKDMMDVQVSGKRIKALRLERRAYYGKFFDLMLEEQSVLEDLYKPLKQRLDLAGGTCQDLNLFVHRKVNCKLWVEKGSLLFDGRSLNRKVDLLDEAENLLGSMWKKGSSEEISEALTAFYSKYWHDMQEAMPDKYKETESEWKQKVAEWIYSVDHISLEYGIRYRGTLLEQLSSGTKGIVLLILYLIIDLDDNRPLIIDQPEENLDPNSVFEELVEPFRKICSRRQVIIVTHNPNLVVNTDVDQVIVANMESPDGSGLPSLSYQSGSIEKREIRDLVCRTLEGGEEAFIDRERRYRIHTRQH